MANSIWKVPLFELDYGEEEKREILDVIKKKWISLGPKAEKFEKEFSEYIGTGRGLLVSSATAGLHISLESLGIGYDDEVIVPSFTFVATVNSVLYTRATPVFADIESERYPIITWDTVKNKITRKTKAVIVVHYAGFVYKVDELQKELRNRGIYLIEDASHSIGSVYKGKKAGNFSDIAVFSFFSNKNISVGEGGFVYTHNPDLFEKLKLLRAHGLTALSWERYKGKSKVDMILLGYNYKPTEITAALAFAQFNKLDKNNEKRKEIVLKYRRELRKLVDFPFTDEDVLNSANYIFPIYLKDEKERDDLKEFLKSKGIQTSIHYFPVHKFTYYKRMFGKVKLGKTEEVASKILSLPLYPSMKEWQVDYVINCIKEFFNVG